MSNVKRVYVEKKAPYAVKAMELKDELHSYLNMKSLMQVRVLIRYDVENISDETYKKALGTVFSEPPIDILYEESFPYTSIDKIFSVEYLPGQFDQTADSAVQCVKLLNENEEPVIRTATTYVLTGDINNDDFEHPSLKYSGGTGNGWTLEQYQINQGNWVRTGDMILYYTDQRATDDFTGAGTH
jgi:phosphoribosylformylglycinamidine synthase